MASSIPNRRIAATLVTGLVAVLTIGLTSAAQAAPTAPTTPTPPTAATPTIAEVTARLTEMGHRNEQLAERLNQAGELVKAKQREVVAAQAAAVRASRVYASARSAIKMLITDQYKGSGLGRTTAILISTSTQDYLDRLTALQQLSDRRTAVAGQLKKARTAAADSSVTATKLLVEARSKQAALKVQHEAVQKEHDKYQVLLDRLTAAQRAAYLARLNPVATKQQTQKAAVTVPVKAPSNGAAIAVQFALAQVGKPYVFAAAGPDSFDCSGLTLAAWARAGVALPHFAASQYNYGTHVSRDQLAPGDLVFFYSPIGHDGMYIGNGLIVHAPTSGDVVKVTPLSVFDSDYVGATRL